MAFLALVDELGVLAAQALRAALGEQAVIPQRLEVQAAARPEFGDLQIAGCLALAKPLAKKPRDLAAMVQQALLGHPALTKVEIAGPGYVNLFLADATIERHVAALGDDPHLGIRQRALGKTAVVDYSSPNVAKPMHIGHIRSTIIGDALCRVLRAVGYRVVADNHIGDWGTQFGKLIVAYRNWLDKPAYAADPIGELVRLYQRFVTEEKAQATALGIKKPERRLPQDATSTDAEPAAGSEGEEDEETPQAVTPLLAAARHELVKLQAGDVENRALWQEFVTLSLREFHKTYARLDVHFDTERGESAYRDRLKRLVEELLEKGLGEISQGAVICPVADEPAPLLVRKADGSFLYGTSDIATIEYRLKTYAPQRVLYVVGMPQQLHFRQVFSVAKRFLGDPAAALSLEHLPFGSMRFRDATGGFVTGSTRLGNVPLLDEFLDEATARARAVAQEKNPELSAAELTDVAQKVGIGAVKYNDLCRDRQSDILFDLDKALSLEGNTAPYIQYAYARLRSIARRAAEEGLAVAPAPTLAHRAERQLGRKLLDYGAVVERVAETCRPHSLCEYLYELSGVVSSLYNELPVLKAAPDERASRLALLQAAARTLAHGLLLLGIAVPERM